MSQKRESFERFGVPASAGKTQQTSTGIKQSSVSPAEAGTPNREVVRLGIFAKTFVRATVEATFDAVAAHGFDCIQFNFSCAGLPSVPEKLPSELASRIGDAARTRGLEIAAVSGTFNMIHPEKAQREAGFRGLQAIAGSCHDLGTRLITLCTGTRDPNDMWRAHPDNNSEPAWRDLMMAMQRAIEIAGRYDVFLGIEPELSNVINSATKARRLLDQVKSPRLRIIMDGANLLSPADLARAKSIWEEAFDLLGSDIAMVHAKDITPDGRFVAAGQGALDYRVYVELMRKANFTGPLILHGLAEDEVADAARFVANGLKGPS